MTPTFPETVRQVAATAGLPTDVLAFEVTETGLMEDADAARKLLEALLECGAYVALDDFGTGYSSLTYLRQLPATAIKIDRSFIEHITDQPGDLAITRSIIDLGRALGMWTIAEGVETVEQLNLLTEMGCNAGQGYLWSPAVPPDELAALLRRQSAGFPIATDVAVSDAVRAPDQLLPSDAQPITAVDVAADAAAVATETQRALAAEGEAADAHAVVIVAAAVAAAAEQAAEAAETARAIKATAVALAAETVAVTAAGTAAVVQRQADDDASKVAAAAAEAAILAASADPGPNADTAALTAAQLAATVAAAAVASAEHTAVVAAMVARAVADAAIETAATAASAALVLEAEVSETAAAVQSVADDAARHVATQRMPTLEGEGAAQAPREAATEQDPAV